MLLKATCHFLAPHFICFEPSWGDKVKVPCCHTSSPFSAFSTQGSSLESCPSPGPGVFDIPEQPSSRGAVRDCSGAEAGASSCKTSGKGFPFQANSSGTSQRASEQNLGAIWEWKIPREAVAAPESLEVSKARFLRSNPGLQGVPARGGTGWVFKVPSHPNHARTL